MSGQCLDKVKLRVPKFQQECHFDRLILYKVDIIHLHVEVSMIYLEDVVRENMFEKEYHYSRKIFYMKLTLQTLISG